ncbi:MAG: response regulator [Candidatus Omnitrophota bacterium]
MGKKKILIIDDEQDMVFFVKANLELTDEYQVITAGSGEEGLKLVLEHRPDLILLDIKLPGKDGFEILNTLKADGSPVKNIPVIMLTALRDESFVARAKGSGAAEYLMKPFTVSELVEFIERCL